jgi:hypothetical protein
LHSDSDMTLNESALYCALQCSVFTEFVKCVCTTLKEIKWRRVLCPLVSVEKLEIYQQSCTDRLHRLCNHLMTLTLREQRCKVRQFWDVIWIVEKSFCRIFENRYVEVRTKILQDIEICVRWHFIRHIVHIQWEDKVKD